MTILAWIVLGLLAGLTARALMPGPQPMGLIRTTLLGVGGAVVGGLIGPVVSGRGVNEFSFWSLLLSVAGAVIILWLYGLATRKSHG